MNMSVDNVVEWYGKNVNYKLNKTFLNFLIKLGIIEYDINLDLLNSYLLEYYDNKLVKENDKYKIKDNKKPIISKFTDAVENEKKVFKNKFKIENLGNKRLKLIKI